MSNLQPILKDAVAEHVLIQAWKKTVAHVRIHNWFADTLELDRATANLPEFISRLAHDMRTPETWTSSPLRMVPAPKGQRWVDDNGDWRPEKKGAVSLRPLAHVALRDQVAATALMMCLADTIETQQGDPRLSFTKQKSRSNVLSYGNRLFCYGNKTGLHHRWGSTTTYRAYFQDYRAFLARPELVAKELDSNDHTVAIIQTDLAQFYDRVRPLGLSRQIARLAGVKDQKFLSLVERVLNWSWHPDDLKTALAYSSKMGIEDFETIALPQGLVAAGFFANAMLLDLDEALSNAIGKEQMGIQFHDAVRYVDDLRFVVSWRDGRDPEDIKKIIMTGFNQALEQHAPGMVAADDKTKIALFRGDKRPLIRQSRKMERIQSAVSGGFDAEAGEEIIEAVQGLVRVQKQSVVLDASDGQKRGSPFRSVPDVGDGTVTRFAATRFRKVYRSLRPLLQAAGRESTAERPVDVETEIFRQEGRTQADLDDDARSFSFRLIDSWIEDPSNVRLLRIALDVWPSHDSLDYILSLIEPYTRGARRGDDRKVALYCLSEIFRAGATETAILVDSDCLPYGVDILAYRKRLRDEAVRLLSLSGTLPWYLNQQAYLYLATVDPAAVAVPRAGSIPETKHYRDMLRFLQGDTDRGTSSDFATNAITARRSFLSEKASISLIARDLNDLRFAQICERDPAFAAEIVESGMRPDIRLPEIFANDMCFEQRVEESGFSSLSDLVLKHDANPLRNEISIASFAHALAIAMLNLSEPYDALTPPNVLLRTASKNGFMVVEEIRLVSMRKKEGEKSIYSPPIWCQPMEQWRFQIGFLLRFILSARRDFTESVRSAAKPLTTPVYRVPKSHWYQRLHGFYNGHEAFGDDWLPISENTESLLFDLLAWPGCREPRSTDFIWTDLRASLVCFKAILEEAFLRQGAASNVLFLPLPAPKLPPLRKEEALRPLRGCVVQLTMPHEITEKDLLLSDPVFRKQHRNHLATALAAISKSLDLRETHDPRGGRLDWLVLPELSVHPEDIKTHIIPFARAYKAIVFAGTAYEEVETGKPIVNSAQWIIPTRTPGGGLRMICRRQGKQHLAKAEHDLIAKGANIRGFRPCQWLVPYPIADNSAAKLILSGSICYDATDLTVPTDLRDRSDVYAISAYNQDVGTFDQMALALHYHMYQMVVIANNGRFGGSNAYMPMKKSYKKQIFHAHGQPQASISFFEIDDPMAMVNRVGIARGELGPDAASIWKYPPAGLL